MALELAGPEEDADRHIAHTVRETEAALTGLRERPLPLPPGPIATQAAPSILLLETALGLRVSRAKGACGRRWRSLRCRPSVSGLCRDVVGARGGLADSRGRALMTVVTLLGYLFCAGTSGPYGFGAAPRWPSGTAVAALAAVPA